MNSSRILLLLILSLYSPLTLAVTLDEALSSALQKNETVVMSSEKVTQAKEQYNQAKAVALPSISLNAFHMIQPKHPDMAMRAASPAEQTTTSLSLAQPLFRGFREFSAMKQRENLLNAEKENRVSTLTLLYTQVASSYLEVLAYEQDLTNVNEQSKLSAERVKELKGRISRGESNSNEALMAQANSAVIDADIQMTQSKLKTARETFAFLTGLPVDTPLTDKEPENLKLRPLEEYLAKIEERPDFKKLKEISLASGEGVSIAKGGHWPSADLIGNYYFQRPEGPMEEQKWDVRLQFTFPLFEGGLRNAQVREAAAKNNEMDLAVKQLRRSIEAEIRSSYDNVRMRADQLKALKTASELSEKNYQVLQRDYRRGLSRNLDVQMAMNEFRVSKRSYDQARFLARLDLIRLEASVANLPPSLKKEM